MPRVLLVLLLILAQPAFAAPALWVVHGAHATVYLLGSLHLLRPGTDWESPAIDRAFDEAQECWFEIDMSAAGILAASGVVRSSGFDFDHQLSDELSPQAWQRLAASLDRDPAKLQHFRPWLAAMMLGQRQWMRAGFTSEAGVDHLLWRKAEAAGKPVHGIETALSQMQLLADMSDTEALSAIEQFLATPERPTDLPNKLTSLWLDGDTDAEVAQFAAMMQLSSPQLARRLLTDRNIVFADAVSRLLDGDKTVLVTVGAAHMAGADGVPALLERRGLTVDRVY